MRRGPGSGCPRAVFMAPHAPRTPPPISEAARPPRPTVVMNSRRPRPTCSVDMGVLPRVPSALPAAQQLTDDDQGRSEEHTSELQSQSNLVCRLLLEKKKYATPLRRY